MADTCCTICGRDNRNATHTALEGFGHLSHPFTPPPVIDAAHLERQRSWSRETFGPGPRTDGLIAHIGKEFDEIRERPDALEEWVDVVILALDGAWRAGHEPQAIVDAIVAKQAENEARTWPDWRAVPEGEPIEHVRDERPGCCPGAGTMAHVRACMNHPEAGRG